jgi:hypothetical protein
MAYSSAWIQLMDIKRAPVWRILVLAKVKALKHPDQHWGCPIEQVEI